MTKRQDELRTVADDFRALWLAGQIDEVEALIAPFRSELATLSSELHMTREEMRENAQRVVWAVASAAITLLVSSVGIILAVILRGG